MNKRISTLSDLATRLDKDPEHRREYARQKPYHDLLREIIRARKSLNLTQAELAERAGTHQSRISRIESAEYDVRLSTIIQIAEALNSRVEIRLVENAPVDDGARDGDSRKVMQVTAS